MASKAATSTCRTATGRRVTKNGGAERPAEARFTHSRSESPGESLVNNADEASAREWHAMSAQPPRSGYPAESQESLSTHRTSARWFNPRSIPGPGDVVCPAPFRAPASSVVTRACVVLRKARPGSLEQLGGSPRHDGAHLRIGDRGGARLDMTRRQERDERGTAKRPSLVRKRQGDIRDECNDQEHDEVGNRQ